MLHLHTPLIRSTALSAHLGRSVHLKMEALQPSGSFKMRGIGHACELAAARGVGQFVSSSGGNAGIAVAVAGRQLGIPVRVIVPETTSQRARDLLALEGAQVTVHGASWKEAHAMAQALVREDDALIHPFDDPAIWAGHASMIDEVIAAGLRPDLVVVAVGGGGLLAGVVEGLNRNGLSAVPILAVETQGADSLSQAIRAGRVVELPRIDSVATSLGARAVCERALQITRERPVHSLVVTDLAAVQACSRFLDDHRVLVEPACGAALAPLYERAPLLGDHGDILVIVCGGAGVTVGGLQALRDTL